MSNLRPLRSMLPSKHQENFSKFAADLEQSVKQSSPTDFGRYRRASILSFDWSNDTRDDKGVRDEFLQLLRTVYGFETESYVLRAHDPPPKIWDDFREFLFDFTKKYISRSNEATHLLIYYYTGHSDPGLYEDSLRLAGRVNSKGELLAPYLDWQYVSGIAFSVPCCETLMIMDSCHSVITILRPDSQILTALHTPAHLAFRYTRMLIDEIKAMHGRAFKAADLHAKLLTNAQRNNIGITPIHMTGSRCPNVLFHKIDARETRGLIRAPTTTAKVLITVSLAANGNGLLPTADEWNTWLSSHVPPGIRDVEIIAHWDAFSKTMLVSMPVQVWDFLRDNPSYSFVSYLWGKVQVGLPSREGGREGGKGKANDPP